MDVIERAIRSAFEKGDAEDRGFRERVYRQAFAALDRALSANPNATVEAAMNRRKGLQDKITEIEAEFIGAAAARDAAAGEPEAAFDDEVGYADAPPAVEPDRASADGGRAPEVATPPRRGDRREPGAGTAGVHADALRGGQPGVSAAPTLDAPAEPLLDRSAGRRRSAASAPAVEAVSGGYDPRIRQRRGSFRSALVALLLLALLGACGWWAVRAGWIALPRGENAGEVRTTLPEESEDFAPDDTDGPPPLQAADAAPERDWVTIFSPADPAGASAPSDATAEAMQDDSGAFLRIRSGGSGSAVGFDVGQGVLEELAGRKAVFDIVARAEPGGEEAGQSEVSVECDFGALGDCGRRRFAVGFDRAEYLIEVELPAGTPSAGGAIRIVPDFAGQGRAVDIYEIRVATE